MSPHGPGSRKKGPQEDPGISPHRWTPRQSTSRSISCMSSSTTRVNGSVSRVLQIMEMHKSVAGQPQAAAQAQARGLVDEAHRILYETIPQDPSYAQFVEKQGPFFEAYRQLQTLVDGLAAKENRKAKSLNGHIANGHIAKSVGGANGLNGHLNGHANGHANNHNHGSSHNSNGGHSRRPAAVTKATASQTSAPAPPPHVAPLRKPVAGSQTLVAGSQTLVAGSQTLEERFEHLRRPSADAGIKGLRSKMIQNQQPLPPPLKPQPVSEPQPDVISLSVTTVASQLERSLLLDVRKREDFDAKQIPATFIACLEPISLRPGMTVQQLEDTLVIAPQAEQDAFARRRDMEYVVLYDAHSHDVGGSPYLAYVAAALAESGLRPYVLRGGLEAWTRAFPQERSVSPLRMPSPPPRSAPSVPHLSNSASNSVSNLSHSVPSRYLPKQPPPVPSLAPPPVPQSSVPVPPVPLSRPPPTPAPAIPPKIPEYPQLPPQGRTSSRYAHSPSPPTATYQSHSANHSSHSASHSASPSPAPSRKGISHGELVALSSTTGLRNLGNTCYMNCVVQCLLSVAQLVLPFLNMSYRQRINVHSRMGHKGQLAEEFGKLVRAVAQPGVNYVEPNGLKALAGYLVPEFAGYEQQDCQEFLTFVLDGLHEDLNANGHMPRAGDLDERAERQRERMAPRAASAIEWERYLASHTSLIVDIFLGQVMSRLQCSVCGQTSTTYNAFSSLSLPIPHRGSRKTSNAVSLKDCFDEFVRDETLEGENAWNCPHCKRKQRTFKTLRISHLPEILVVHLTRFRRTSSGADKLETPVHYPLKGLDLTQYWPSSSPDDTATDNILAQLPARGQQPPFIYDLCAVTLHSGTLKGGHYTAVVYKPMRGWCYYDDTNVTPVKETAALSPSAYVLFYRRRL